MPLGDLLDSFPQVRFGPLWRHTYLPAIIMAAVVGLALPGMNQPRFIVPLTSLSSICKPDRASPKYGRLRLSLCNRKAELSDKRTSPNEFFESNAPLSCCNS
jgi:hypothetical protein